MFERLLVAAMIVLACPRAWAAPCDPVEYDPAHRLFAFIASQVLPHADEGTVAPDHVLTTDNVVTPTAFQTGSSMKREGNELRELFARARYEIAWQTWDWQAGDVPAEAALHALKNLEQERKRRGETGPPVRFHLLVYKMPFKSTSYIEDIAKEVEAMHFDPKHIDVQISAWRRPLLGALHSKHVVVDGREVVFTGANTNDNYGPPVSNLDAGFHMTGGAARAAREDFVDAWKQADRWTCGTDWRAVVKKRHRWPAHRHVALSSASCWENNDAPPAIPELEPLYGRPGNTTVLLLSSRAHGWPWHRNFNTPYDRAYLGAVWGAFDHVRILTPNLNDPSMKDAVIFAARRGRRVEIVLSKNFEHLPQSLPSRGGPNEDTVDWLYDALEAEGVAHPCEVLDIRWFSRDGRTPVETSSGPPASHTKYLSADDTVAIVGSANQDIQSWHNSREVGAAVFDGPTTRAWDDQLFEPVFERAIPVARCPRD